MDVGRDDDRERALVQAALAGDEGAAAEIVRRETPQLWRAAYALLGQREAAEDVLQEAFEKAFRGLERLDRSRAIGPWLQRIMVNCALDALRRRSRRPEAALTDDVASGPDESTHATETVDLVRTLARLHPDRRAAVVLRHYLGYSPAEIATMMGVPEGTVSSRLDRGRRDLRGLLDEDAR